ncbi:hypothetical protein H9L12_08085 [Sphingomonas rhizophila]|uniref:Uncharacterized protein n=1 Tax=Sphingomonas rhizophila TaxID=2071607 RepID=A0A7G9S8X9_9SPHN|nr:hypothetical protein [Sphingomonas rhizophila]QNN64304.1 hypothetical protein H9L12_08085 [Sphingomonas rhizophila]
MSELAKEFDRLHAALVAELAPHEVELVNQAKSRLPTNGRTYGFEDVGKEAKAALKAVAALPSEQARTASRATIAGLAASNADRLRQGLTARVGERSEVALRHLLDFLSSDLDASYRYPDDHFLKDYRFVTGMTVPCGAQVVDLAERPGLKTVVSIAGKSPRLAWHAISRPWFRPHTEDRYLDEFNEKGWDRCYAEVGDLLTALPEVAGFIATSWFYDPALAEVSPRLDYLRRVPVEGGALMVRHGTTPFDIKSSTATSPTRRALYEQGKYVPTCWSIVWPRREMLAWCERSPAAGASTPSA